MNLPLRNYQTIIYAGSTVLLLNSLFLKFLRLSGVLKTPGLSDVMFIVVGKKIIVH
jgi:hypothetical protein